MINLTTVQIKLSSRFQVGHYNMLLCSARNSIMVLQQC